MPKIERFRLHPLKNTGYSLNSDPAGEYMLFADYDREVGEADEALSAAEARADVAEASAAYLRAALVRIEAGPPYTRGKTAQRIALEALRDAP